ncbi:MAG TPA: Na+/H+ antiporter subunit E [Rhodocyclaceae bacterium]
MSLGISAFIALLAFWLLLSGLFTPFLIAAGVGCALAVVLFSRRMAVIDHEGLPTHLRFHEIALYWIWLVGEIIKSGLTVSRIILDPKLPISPTLTSFKPLQKTSVGLVIHANSITLTPGTLTVRVAPDRILVHALTRSGAADAAGGSEMDRRVAALEKH